jgi:hypothetical protein
MYTHIYAYIQSVSQWPHTTSRSGASRLLYSDACVCICIPTYMHTYRVSRNGRTPLHVAALHGRTECAQMLLQSAATNTHNHPTPSSTASVAEHPHVHDGAALCGQRDSGQKDGGQKDGGQKDGGQKDDGSQKDGGQKDVRQKDGGQKDDCQKDCAVMRLLMVRDCGGAVALHEAAAGGHVDVMRLLVEVLIFFSV